MVKEPECTNPCCRRARQVLKAEAARQHRKMEEKYKAKVASLEQRLAASEERNARQQDEITDLKDSNSALESKLALTVEENAILERVNEDCQRRLGKYVTISLFEVTFYMYVDRFYARPLLGSHTYCTSY